MNVMDLVWHRMTTSSSRRRTSFRERWGCRRSATSRKRNVKVTILTNSLASNDEPVVHTGYSRYRVDAAPKRRRSLRAEPERIQRNKRLSWPGMSLGRLHAKTAVIDRKIVFIGSMNLDPRSASKNTELGIIAESPQLAKEVLRVIHLSKLQSAYRLRFGPDGQSLEWLTMDDEGEVVLVAEPESTLLMRLQNVLLAPFVPEQQL